MTVLTILTEPDPILRQISQPVDQVDDALRAFMDDMLETMYAAQGIGLAAIQVGVAKRVIVIDISSEDNPGTPLYFVNPVITPVGDDMSVYKEGCLSIPEITENVERPAVISIEYLDYHGVPQTLQADGLLATCMQHEMDHLEGVLFIDKLSKLKRQLVMRKLKKRKNIKLI
ncbi:MAG: peptide deformylase [Pseudomonadota bacterium]